MCGFFFCQLFNSWHLHQAGFEAHLKTTDAGFTSIAKGNKPNLLKNSKMARSETDIIEITLLEISNLQNTAWSGFRELPPCRHPRSLNPDRPLNTSSLNTDHAVFLSLHAYEVLDFWYMNIFGSLLFWNWFHYHQLFKQWRWNIISDKYFTTTRSCLIP